MMLHMANKLLDIVAPVYYPERVYVLLFLPAGVRHSHTLIIFCLQTQLTAKTLI